LPQPARRPPLAEALRYAQIGTMLVAPMLGLGAVGYLLDKRFDTTPWLLLAGLLAGMAAGFVSFLRLVLEPPRGGPGGDD
jgi:F0F1-type ATP synthase assembly protein I